MQPKNDLRAALNTNVTINASESTRNFIRREYKRSRKSYGYTKMESRITVVGMFAFAHNGKDFV